MSKQPAFQFYPGDWRRDTQVQMASMSTRGVWIEMLCCMWDAPERGKLVGTIGEISRLLGCDGFELIEALRQIERLKIGNVEGLECYKNVTCNADATKCNGVVTVINRRMYREETVRKQTRKRVAKHREEKKKQDCNADITPPSSSSSSSSSSNSIIYSPNSIEFRLADLLLTKILDINPNFKKPNLQKWAVHIDRMIRLDKREPPEIAKVIEWCQQDDFWQDNILSTRKLRMQYDQLVMKMNKPKRYKKGFDSNRLLKTIAEVQLD